MHKTRKRGQGAVRKHHGSFEASISLGKQRHYKSFDKEADAWAWIATIKADHVRGILKVEPPKAAPAEPMTFGTIARLMIVHKTTSAKRPWRPGNTRFVRGHLKSTIFPAFDHVLARDITSDQLQAWLDTQSRRQILRRYGPDKGKPSGKLVQPGTVAKYEEILSMVFAYGVKIKQLEHNPMRDVERVVIQPEQQKTPRVLQAEELKKLLEVMPARPRAFFLLLAFSGLRRSEAFRARWDWIDWDGRMIRVRIAKRGASEVPMGPRVRAALLELRPQAPHEVWSNDNPAPFVFPGFSRAGARGARGDGQRMLTDMRRPLADALKASGVTAQGVGMHTFRHTFLTLVDALPGMRFALSVALARHSKRGQGMTARYLHPSAEDLYQAVAALERRVFEEPVVRLLKATA